jgi:hypothetical protein
LVEWSWEGGREVRREGRERRGIAYSISVTVELTLRASASFSAPASPILFPPNLIGWVKLGGREVRRGIAYQIWVTVELTFRASASFSAPASPILFPPNLIGWVKLGGREGGEERRKREERDCLLDTSDGRVDFESLGQLLGSSIPDFIPTQPDWLSEVGRERGRWGEKEGRRENRQSQKDGNLNLTSA